MLDIEKFADTGQLFDNHYRLIRPLNTEGGTADVWLALDTTTVSDKEALDKAPFLNDEKLSEIGLLVAIKIYKPKNALDIEGERRFREEFVIVFNCNHANLIHPAYFSIFEETPYLVLPYCQRGSSELLIGGFVKDDDLWRYIHDVAAGLNYLHHCNPPIIHQDVKPANVLIDDSGHYALTDFGISAKRFKQLNNNSDDDYYEEQSGTFAYMAPERFIEGNTPSAESDIWAFGATLYELLTGHVPFGEDGGLVQPDGKVSLPFKDIKISDDIKRLICACLSKNPSERPTAEQLLNATNQKRFKLAKRSVPVGKFLGILCALIVIGLGAWYLMSHQITGSEPKPEDLFKDALVWINASTIDSVKTGIEKLDSLAKQNYEPAILEMPKIIGPKSLTAEKALAAFSQAQTNFHSIKKTTELSDGIAVNILGYYDSALEWAILSKENKLIEEYRNCRDSFIDDVIMRYDRQIEWGQAYNDMNVVQEFSHYKKSFSSAVESTHHELTK